jgi:hypothetical protein
LLLNAACLAEKQPIGNTNFIDFGLPQPGLEHTIYRILGEHDDHYTADVVARKQTNVSEWSDMSTCGRLELVLVS